MKRLLPWRIRGVGQHVESAPITARLQRNLVHYYPSCSAHFAPPSRLIGYKVTCIRSMSNNSTAEQDGRVSTASSARGYNSQIQEDFRLGMLKDIEENRQTARGILDAPKGSVTPETWLEIEYLINWWSIQRTIESVHLSFALLERILEERQSQQSSHTSWDSHHWLHVDLLNRILNNWRVLWWERHHQQQLSEYTPREVWKKIEHYYKVYDFAMNEKSFYLILEADITQPGDSEELKENNKQHPSADFAQEILNRCLKLSEMEGLIECLPSTDLFNLIQRAWITSGQTDKAPRKCEDIFNLMRQHEVTVSKRTYRRVIQAWALTETEAGALRAQEWLERMHTEYLEGNEQMKPDSAAVATAIAAWSRSGARDAVKQAWKLFQRLGDYVEFDKIHVINSLLTCFSRSKRIDGNQMALQLFNDLLEHSTEKNSAKPLPDSTSYLIVLSALATLGRPEEAEIILQRMKEEYHTGHTSSKITNSHCTAVVSALAKSDRIDKVDKIRSFLTQMEDWSISMNDESLKPSLATYNAFLSCFANGNVPFAGSEAEKVLRTMKTYAAAGQLQYTPDRVSYTSVINCLARYGLSERAVSVLGEMHTDFSNGNASASPDLQTYNTVLASFAKEKRNKNAIAHAVQFFGKMKQLAATGFIAKLDVVSYATLMNVYAHSPHRHKDKIFTAQCSENLLREMQAAYKEDGGIRPNHVAYNTCINCWANAGRPDRAGEILQEMVQDYQTGNSRARPDVTSFNTTMKAFAFARRPDSGKRAEEILERMKDLHNSGALKVRPDAVTYSTLILCYALTKQAKSLERAEEILRHMDELYNTGELDQGATKQAFEAICKGWSVCRDVSGSERMQVLQNEMRLRFGSAPLPSTRDRYARK